VLNQKRGLRDQLGLRCGSRDVAAMAPYAEGYNGFGSRNRGVTSAYVASGTPLYTGGQYIRDGGFSRTARDLRKGVLSIIAEMMRRRLWPRRSARSAARASQREALGFRTVQGGARS
jgi:hypothetical protein